MKFWKANGLYYAHLAGGKELVARTFEGLIALIDPGAPPEKVSAAAEIFEPHVGKGHEQIQTGVKAG